jgi:hypothetical protein
MHLSQFPETKGPGPAIYLTVTGKALAIPYTGRLLISYGYINTGRFACWLLRDKRNESDKYIQFQAGIAVIWVLLPYVAI